MKLSGLAKVRQDKISAALRDAFNESWQDFGESLKYDLTVEFDVLRDDGGAIRFTDPNAEDWLRLPFSKLVNDYIKDRSDWDHPKNEYDALASILEREAKRLRKAGLKCKSA